MFRGSRNLKEPIGKHSQYSTEQFADNYPEGMENNHWIYARSLFVRRILRRYVSATTRILEIGCGAGIVLDCLARAGLKCRGVELGKPRLMPTVEGITWTGTRFQELEPSYRSSVEMVLLLDVIEHIESPDVFLREVTVAFPHLDRVLITVPARQELWSNYDEHFGHYRRYDRPSLSDLMVRNGYEVDEIGYFFHTLYAAMLVVSKLGFKRQVKNTRPRPLWLHRFVSYWHFVENIILPRWLIGGSLYVVARKK